MSDLNPSAAATPLKRPIGVTIIAVINILAGVAVTVMATLLFVSSQQPQGIVLGIFVIGALLGFALGVALLMLQNWARLLMVVGCVLSLIVIPARMFMMHSLVDALEALLRGLYFVWVVWYLLQPHVKAAFSKRS